MDRIEQQIAALSENLKETSIRLETRFDGLETRFDGLEVKVDRLEYKADIAEARLDKHDDLFSEMFQFMRDQFESVDREFAKVHAHLLRRDLIFEEWRSDSRAFNEGLQSNRGRIEGLEIRVDSLESKAG